MTAAALLYTGRTAHERRTPFTHRFTYRLAMMAIDLDRLDEAERLSPLFSVERFNLFSFRQRDHGPRDGSSLSDWASAKFADAGVDTQDCAIRLICSPRVLGHVFNPISVYLARDDAGVTRGVIYQVHNTFGDAHAYVARLDDAAPHRHHADKAFHVSPFFDVGGRYEFTLRPPQTETERFQLSLLKQREAGPDFFASMVLRPRALTTGNLLGLFASQPFSTLKTVAGIHFEALRLWLKGARYHARPAPPGTDSVAQPMETVPVSLGRETRRA